MDKDDCLELESVEIYENKVKDYDYIEDDEFIGIICPTKVQGLYYDVCNIISTLNKKGIVPTIFFVNYYKTVKYDDWQNSNHGIKYPGDYIYNHLERFDNWIKYIDHLIIPEYV